MERSSATEDPADGFSNRLGNKQGTSISPSLSTDRLDLTQKVAGSSPAQGEDPDVNPDVRLDRDVVAEIFRQDR
jgi:hypothetical protein